MLKCNDKFVKLTEHDKYIEKFYNPEFTAYDFLALFSTLLASIQEYSFDRESLIEFICFCQKNSEFLNILSDISLKYTGVSYYSEELEEAIGKLKWARILYTVSPEQDSTIYICENIPITELIKPREKFVQVTDRFIQKYKEFDCSRKIANDPLALNIKRNK